MPKKPVVSIHARVLGDASITTGVATIEPIGEIVFAAALYLILRRKEPVTRGMIQALLWPDAPARVAAHRMRQTLLKLRQLGMPIELSGKGHIGLNGAPVSVDYEEFLAKRTVEDDSNDSLVMLPGYEPRFSQPYLEWLDAQKAEVNASLTRVMLGIIARHRVKGEWVEVERNATRLLRFQPYNEEATLAMAEACAMRGDKLDAMAILDRYLNEVGSGSTDLRVPATIMRRRIADRAHPRAEAIIGQSPLVGRSNEMGQLGELLELCRDGRGQACLVWGDAGIGKTRLLAEFARFASLQGIPTQRVQCRPSDSHRPLSIFVDLVPGLRAMRGAIGCSAETFLYLDRLTKQKASAVDAVSIDGDPEFIYAKVKQALFDLVDAVSDEGCLIVLVEDVHWLDSTSSMLLHDMISWAAEHSVLFAFTGRDAPAAWLSGLAEPLTGMRLAPLEVGPSRDVVLGVVTQQAREIDERYLSWCVNVAEGNPYFLQELANQWVEQGDQKAAPPSLAAVLNTRIERLEPDALLLLQTCALLGKNSSVDRIGKIIEFEAHRMIHAINTLGFAGMLIVETDETGNGAADKLLSRHDLLSNTALNRLTAPARAFLHRRAGAVFEEEITDEHSASILWDCATHWQMAGNVGRALQLAKSCATHLMEVGLPGSAAEAYEKSLDYCRTLDDRLSILEALAQAYDRTNAWDRVRDAVAKARAIKRELNPKASHHDELELMDIHAAWFQMLPTVPVEQALDCLHDEQASPDHRVKAGVLALMMLDVTGQQEEMREPYALIEHLADDKNVNISGVLEARMVYHTLSGSTETALEATQALIANERGRGNGGDLCRRLGNAALVFRILGRFDEAVVALLEGDSLAVNHRMPLARFAGLTMLAHLELERGNTTEAQRWYDTMLSLAQPQTAEYLLDISCVGARLALLNGNPKLARKRFGKKLKDVLHESFAQRRAYGLAMDVSIDLAMGRISIPALSALESTHLASRQNLHQSFAVSVLFRALQRVNRADRADQLLDEYVKKYRRERWPMPEHFFSAG